MKEQKNTNIQSKLAQTTDVNRDKRIMSLFAAQGTKDCSHNSNVPSATAQVEKTTYIQKCPFYEFNTYFSPKQQLTDVSVRCRAGNQGTVKSAQHIFTKLVRKQRPGSKYWDRQDLQGRANTKHTIHKMIGKVKVKNRQRSVKNL